VSEIQKAGELAREMLTAVLDNGLGRIGPQLIKTLSNVYADIAADPDLLGDLLIAQAALAGVAVAAAAAETGMSLEDALQAVLVVAAQPVQ
jgi:hypothetical protein